MKIGYLHTNYTLKPYKHGLIKSDGIYHGRYMGEQALIRFTGGEPVTVYMMCGMVNMPEKSGLMVMITN